MKEKDKQIYGGMFDKFARADANKAARAGRNGVMKGGVGEWDDDDKKEEDGDKDGGELKDVKLLSSGDEIKGEEFMKTTS